MNVIKSSSLCLGIFEINPYSLILFVGSIDP